MILKEVTLLIFMLEHMFKDIFKLLQNYFHAFLSMKKIYRNWEEILLQHLLKKEKVNIVFRNSKTKTTVPFFVVEGIISLVKNLNFEPYYFMLRDNKLYYRNRKLSIKNIFTLYLSANNWRKKDNIWINDKLGVKLKNISLSIYEIFHLKVYDCFDVKGREVIDIGANIGDSSIYFAMKGQRRSTPLNHYLLSIN